MLMTAIASTLRPTTSHPNGLLNFSLPKTVQPEIIYFIILCMPLFIVFLIVQNVEKVFGECLIKTILAIAKYKIKFSTEI